MSLPDELLETARYLTRRYNNRPTAADRRRAVSTAYYALFHRLIQAAVGGLLPAPAQWALLARVFEHGRMKALCQKLVRLADIDRSPGLQSDLHAVSVLIGWPVGDELRRVAEALVTLQERRHQADYDAGTDVTRQHAQAAVGRASDAFADLAAVEGTPAGRAFLLLLLIGEPKAR